MSQQKTITLPISHIRFVKGKEDSVTEIARETLERCMAGEHFIPNSGTRDTEGEKKRTSVRLEQRYVDFIDEKNLNLSRLLREEIGTEIANERSLQHAENAPGYVVSEGDRAIIAIRIRTDQLQWTEKTFENRYIRWYQTGFSK